jgi:hypothetical protein
VPSGIRPWPWVERMAVHRVRLARQAGVAFAAFGRVERNDVIALLHGGDAGADIDHHARTLMPEDRREEAFRIGARQGELVGMADARRLDLDQNLTGTRAFELYGHDLKWFSSLNGNGGAYVHLRLPMRILCRADHCRAGSASQVR